MKTHDPLCKNCKCPIDFRELKRWRWSGWSVSGYAPSAPPNEDKTLDGWDFDFHKDCFSEWLENRNGFLQDLDRPINNCLYFVRTGSSSHGYYVRDGKKHAVLASWTEADIGLSTLFESVAEEIKLDFDFVKIKVTDSAAFLRSFRAFLQKEGWWGTQWFEPRKQFEVKDVIAKKHINVDSEV